MISLPLSRPFWTAVSLLYLSAAVVFLAVLISLWAFGNGKTAEMILDWPNLPASAIMLSSVVAGLVGVACFVTVADAFRTAAISIPRPIAYGRLACGTLAGSCLLSLFVVHSWRINRFIMLITVPPMFASIVCFHLTLEAMRIARGKASSVLGTLVSAVLLADGGVSILFGRITFMPSNERVDGLASALFAGQILACLLLAAETVLTPTEE